MRLLKLCLLVFLPLLGTSLVYGQGWIKDYGTVQKEQGSAIQQTIDGGYVSAGKISHDMYLVKTDANGDTLWTKNYGGTNQETASSVQQTTDGGYIVAGTVSVFGVGADDFYLVKTDANGDTLWTKTYGGSNKDIAYSVQQTTDGGYIVAGHSINPSNVVHDIYLVKTDANGDTLWTKTYGGTYYDVASSVQQTTDGGYILGGSTIGFATGTDDFYLVKTDANGDTLWTKNYDRANSKDIAYSVQQTTDGGYILGGYTNSFATGDDMYLVKTDANGDTLWTKTYGGTNDYQAFSVQQTTDGGYILGGEIAAKPALIKTNLNGDVLWEKRYNNTFYSSRIEEVVQTQDNGYVFVYNDSIFSVLGDQLIIVKIDSLGNVYTNEIHGNVFQDNDNSCTNNLGDINLEDLIIKAENLNGDIFYTTTDSMGNYSMVVDSGTYTITIESLLPYYSFSCQPNGITISFSGFYQPAQTVDFALELTAQCPLMQVDISAPFIRQTGGGSNYTVSYCNAGTDTAYNAYVEVDLDASLTFTGSSIPHASQNGNLYTFNLGNIGLGDCGSFTINVIADSTALVGKTICSDVYIYPDSVCIPNYWNGAILSAGAACNNDTVTFTIQNKGAPMTQGTQYFVYEDNIIFRTGTTNILGTGATQQVQQYAAVGKTYRIEVWQEANFPDLLGDTTTTAVMEGCNPYPNGTFNTGFVTNLSNDNSSPFMAIDCQPLVASYDPNDKSAQPEGYGTAHYIYNYTALDYKIRFQNTGTDTAFRVVIRDTLSAHLDIASIQMGASSHNYTWRVYGAGILEITFDNIMLPDSNVNEPESNGFVRFRIDQVPNNPDGTVIYNDAAIYFDYNAPIITNETFHTIGSNFVTMLVTGVEDILVQKDITVKVYPNPFKEQATLEVVGGDYQELRLTVYDITGRAAMEYRSTGDQRIQLQRNNLPQGVYIYKLEGDGELVNTGKIIID